MPSPKVSVIIPVYNAEKTIGNILSKLITQAYTNIEIIVINDGSSDGSLKILQDAARSDERIEVIDQKNGGVSAARNAGIEKASGEFITFIDSDDNFSVHLIAELVHAVSDDSDFVMCGMKLNGHKVISPDATLIGKDTITGYVLKSLLTKNLLYGPYCKLFRRSYIIDHKIKFPEEVKYGEDTIFVLRYLGHSSHIEIIGQALYFYMFSSGGLASNNSHVTSFRRARTLSLNDYMRSNWSLYNFFLYILLRLRWTTALMKARFMRKII